MSIADIEMPHAEERQAGATGAELLEAALAAERAHSVHSAQEVLGTWTVTTCRAGSVPLAAMSVAQQVCTARALRSTA